MMHVERHETMLHPDLTEGGVRLNVFLSNFCDEDLDDVLIEWLESDDEVCVSNYFSLSDALSSAIELHQMPAHAGAIDGNAMPLFDAMRDELKRMIEKIDSLRFAMPTNGSAQ